MQGESSIAAFILVALHGCSQAQGEAESDNGEWIDASFWIFTAIIFSMEDYVAPGMKGLIDDSLLAQKLAGELSQSMWQKAEKAGFEFVFLTPSWWLCLFSESGASTDLVTSTIDNFVFHIPDLKDRDGDAKASPLPESHRLVLLEITLECFYETMSRLETASTLSLETILAEMDNSLRNLSPHCERRIDQVLPEGMDFQAWAKARIRPRSTSRTTTRQGVPRTSRTLSPQRRATTRRTTQHRAMMADESMKSKIFFKFNFM